MGEASSSRRTGRGQWGGRRALCMRELRLKPGGPFEAGLWEHPCPQAGGGSLPAGPGRGEEEQEGFHFSNSQCLTFPWQSWPGLHTSRVSKERRLWKDLWPFWKCARKGAGELRECVCFSAFRNVPPTCAIYLLSGRTPLTTLSSRALAHTLYPLS